MKKAIIIGVVVLAIAGIGYGVYYYNKKQSKPTAAKTITMPALVALDTAVLNSTTEVVLQQKK